MSGRIIIILIILILTNNFSQERINKLLKPYDYQIRDKRCIEAILAIQCFWSLEKTKTTKKKNEQVSFEQANKNTSTFARELYLMITSSPVKKQKLELDDHHQENFSVVPFQLNIQVSM